MLWQASCPAGTGPYGVSEPASGSVCGEGYCKDFDGDDNALRCVCCTTFTVSSHASGVPSIRVVAKC